MATSLINIPSSVIAGIKAHPVVLLVIVYVTAVQIYDYYTMHEYLIARCFDAYKFSAFLVVPLLLSLRKMDWGYYGVKRWRRIDAYFLAALLVVGILAVWSISIFPSLSSYYQPHGAEKSTLFVRHMAWLVSWLIGWEFLHRYFLLTHVSKAWPRFGWLLVPLCEGLVHLQKPALEAVGMVLLSLVITFWAVKRRNGLFPFLVHAAIEVDLLIYLLLV